MEFKECDTKVIRYNHLVEYDLDNFLLFTNNTILVWCDGYLLSFTRYNLKTFEEMILKQGERCYDVIAYCKMDKYESEFKDKHNNTYMVLNDSTNKIHSEVARFLHEREKD